MRTVEVVLHDETVRIVLSIDDVEIASKAIGAWLDGCEYEYSF